jgi:hypothetical protein
MMSSRRKILLVGGSLFGVFHMLHLSDGYATFVSWLNSRPNPRP